MLYLYIKRKTNTKYRYSNSQFNKSQEKGKITGRNKHGYHQ